jgi:glycerophosphoryl diester phosphodiesterase
VLVRHPFFESPRVLVFAHRGGAALAPENTIAAFDNGLELGADGIELDVRASRDGAIVVHHDATLDRTTNRPDPVDSLDARDLARVDAGYRFSAQGTHPFRGQGIGVPTLAEVLRRYRDRRIIVEMKLNSAEFAAAVVEVVRSADAVDRVCLGSFGRRSLSAARILEPALATSAAREEVRWALYRSWCRWPVKRPPYAGYQVPERAEATRVVSPAFVRHSHAVGLGVQVWTVDTPLVRVLETPALDRLFSTGAGAPPARSDGDASPRISDGSSAGHGRRRSECPTAA